jgi:hypothetical protein
MKEDITLSIPKAILRAAKHLAAQQGLSLSGFLIESLTERVKGLRKIQKAGARQRSLMRRGLKLGTKGQATWKRDDLHAR